MKNVLIALALLLPSLLIGQSSETDYKDNSVGFHFDYSGDDGLSSGIRYIKHFSHAGELKLAFTSNFSTIKSARLGYNFLKIHKNKFSLHLGLDAAMTWYDYTKFEQGKYRDFNLEMPIELRYAFSPQFTAFAGTSLSKNIHSTTLIRNKDFHWTNSRIGLMYSF